jgi:hypothetical protein
MLKIALASCLIPIAANARTQDYVRQDSNLVASEMIWMHMNKRRFDCPPGPRNPKGRLRRKRHRSPRQGSRPSGGNLAQLRAGCACPLTSCSSSWTRAAATRIGSSRLGSSASQPAPTEATGFSSVVWTIGFFVTRPNRHVRMSPAVPINRDS